MLKALCVLIRRTVWHTFSEPTSCSWDKQMSRAQKVPANNSTVKGLVQRSYWERNQCFLYRHYCSGFSSFRVKKARKMSFGTIRSQDLTCSSDPGTAVDHHRGTLWVARPLRSQSIHHFPLLSLHSAQEINESHCRGGNAVVRPAEVLEMTHLSLLTRLRWKKEDRVTV